MSQDIVERLRAQACIWTVGDAASEQHAEDCDTAASVITTLTAERDALAKALEPLNHYVRCRQAMPMRGIGDSVHTIHVGSEFEAELTFSQLEAIAALSRSEV